MLDSSTLDTVAKIPHRFPQGAVGERRQSVGASSKGVPDPELAERPRRRRFSAEYKLGVVREADALTRTGEIGAMLRREGLDSSHLATWRKQRDIGALVGLAPRKRGPLGQSPAQVELGALRRRLERTEADLKTARRVIEVQGNALSALGRSAGAQERDRDRRPTAAAMIDQAVAERGPLVGTAPACRVLGVCRASLSRRRFPAQVYATLLDEGTYLAS